MLYLVSRCPPLFWNVSPLPLTYKVDGHLAEKAESNGSSTGAFRPQIDVDSLLSV